MVPCKTRQTFFDVSSACLMNFSLLIWSFSESPFHYVISSLLAFFAFMFRFSLSFFLLIFNFACKFPDTWPRFILSSFLLISPRFFPSHERMFRKISRILKTFLLFDICRSAIRSKPNSPGDDPNNKEVEIWLHQRNACHVGKSPWFP